MCNKLIFYCACFFFLSSLVSGQECQIRIDNTITDAFTQAPLPAVHVVIQELRVGAHTDDDGKFLLDDICPGDYHLVVSHVGCEPEELHLHLESDTTLPIVLYHTPISLTDVVVEGQSSRFYNQLSQSVTKQTIEDNVNQNLSMLLENEAGVYSLKNGNGVAKPIIQGMFGNRLNILNNGILQSGQQWGNDHSPEIDPLVANRITIVKGTNALEYGGGNYGAIILVESRKIDSDPHLHGRINYAFETNGRGNNLNIQLQKYNPGFSWRLSGTLKNYGDRKAPDYFLNNTGLRESNAAVEIQKSWRQTTFLDAYASTFNTEIGILRGSHIGNTTDLNSALGRAVPFFTEENFSRDIEAPRQRVGHHLLKLDARHFFEENESVQLIVAAQLNDRKEFDVRRSGRDAIPALSLSQYTISTDIKYKKEWQDHWSLHVGNQNFFIDNTNDPETGILPLIPDYFSFRSGVFVTANKYWNATSMNIGARYDYEWQNVPTITNTTPRRILRYKNNFHNFNATLGFRYTLSDLHELTFNTGYTMRNPGINELYSQGLHQGVSGIEEGDPDLIAEKSIKSTLGYTAQLGSGVSFESIFYYQYVNDYIFLNPQDEVRLTIRGAFPVFKYEQTNAQIYGVDISSQITVLNSLVGQLKFSYIKGEDQELNTPLIYIPPMNAYAALTYRKHIPITGAKIHVDDLEFQWNNRYVFEQTNYLPGQDFIPPPSGYNIMGLKVSANLTLPKYKLRIFIKTDNVLNARYRDYLNRLRYFADDTGFSATIGANLKF